MNSFDTLPYSNLTVDGIQLDDSVINKAKNGDAEALYAIGDAYFDKKDYKNTILWTRASAEKESVQAELRMGRMYDLGFGVPVEYSLAFEWYAKAANHGNAWAQNNIGSLYLLGDGVTPDFELAMDWYLKAARQGHTVAKSNIELLLQNDWGVSMDRDEAFILYKEIASLGIDLANDKMNQLHAQNKNDDDDDGDDNQKDGATGFIQLKSKRNSK
ncbi:HCP-like protein [Backusella circina FSU 941]|nr:HCP-like protein [Backusella circina FSU 941]